MIKWEELKSVEQLPKDGTRFLVCHHGMAGAVDEQGESYEFPALFQIHVLLYIWDSPNEDGNFANTATYRILSPKQVLSIYTHFVIINQPERSKREESQECGMRCSKHCGNTVREVQ